MSWVAHDLEPYILQRKLGRGVAISFMAVLLGSWGPDSPHWVQAGHLP